MKQRKVHRGKLKKKLKKHIEAECRELARQYVLLVCLGHLFCFSSSTFMQIATGIMGS